MDFKTRDLYRKEIEKLAFATGLDEHTLAEITVNLAQPTETDPPETLVDGAVNDPTVDRDAIQLIDERASVLNYPIMTSQAAHIGDFLLGKDRDLLEQQIGYKPDKFNRFKRRVFKHASVFYLSSILLLAIVILASLSIAASLPTALGSSSQLFANPVWDAALNIAGIPIQWIAILMLGLAMLIPVLTIATSLVNWAITLMIQPRTLPKLNFKNEIPEAYQNSDRNPRFGHQPKRYQFARQAARITLPSQP